MKTLKLWVHVLLFSTLLASQLPLTAQPAKAGLTRPDPVEPANSQKNEPTQYNQFSTTWQASDGSYTSVLSPEAQNYLDKNGEWKAIDAQFQPYQDSFIVEHNDIQTRADNRRVWLSAVVGDTLFGWETLALGAASPDGIFRPLAAPLESPAPTAYRRQENRELVYEHSWDDARLTEALVSAPGSLEHTLILEQLPALPVSGAKFLELRARLSLLESSTLLADGKPAASGQTARVLHIQDEQGTVILQFEPVLSYEQGNRSAAVEGEYLLESGTEPGEWIVGMRTPWSWLAALERRYPVVLDPTMTVLKTTGYVNGAAWISSQSNQYYYDSLRLGAYQPDYDSVSRGYFQFHDLPAILTNAPVKVKKATLEISVSEMFLPLYYDSPTDWDEKVINRKGTLSYVGACPDELVCADFSLHDNRLENAAVFNWNNSPAGNPVNVDPVKTISFGPEKGKPKTHITTWDVTSEINGWYTAYFNNQQDHWPVFRLSLNESCPGPLPYYKYVDFWEPSKSVFTYKDVPNCTNFTIPAENIKLYIEYDAIPLALNQNVLNKPGVPSHLSGILEDTAHQYQLATYNPPVGESHWRSVAVRGNHDYIPGPDTTTSVQLLVSATGEKLGSSSALTANGTAALFIDDRAISNLPTTDLLASLPPFDDNDYPSDLQRNYRLEYKMAAFRSVIHGSWTNISPLEDFYTDQLIKVVEFQVNSGDNFLVKAVVPENVVVLMVSPYATSNLGDAVVGFSSSRIYSVSPEGGSGSGFHFIPVSPGGRWALAFIFNGHPEQCVGPDCDIPGGATKFSVDAQILACGPNAVPTGDYGCQTIQMPGTGDPSKEIDLPGTTNDLFLYTEWPFQELTGGWCTFNEGSGTPAFRRESPTNDRAVIVANGRVCYIDGQLFLASNGSTDPATSRAAVNIARPASASADPLGILGTNFIYGNPGKTAFEGGVQIGQWVLDSTGNFEPTPQTLVNIQLFGMYWNQATLTTNVYEIDSLSAKLVADEVLQTQVSADVSQPALPAAWQVAWELYPSTPPLFGYPNYTFTPIVNQTAALPGEIPIASMTLRLISSGAPDGLLPYLDSWHKLSAPSAYQFITPEARVTMDASLGEATQKVKAVVLPPGLARPAEEIDKCDENGILTACLDMRPSDYGFDAVGVKDAPAAWSLPDIHIEDTIGSVLFNQPGALSIYSVDHPQNPQNFSQAFNFDTWGAKVTVSSAACTPGGPVTTITKGVGYISLPGISSDGSSDPGKWIKMTFELCETNLHEASLTLNIEPNAIPVGSSGLGVGLIGGTITVGPDYTEITIDVHFRSMDGSLFSDGEGSVTINTAGMFDLQGSGNLVGFVRADTLELQVAWNPLDILFKGDVSCCGGLVEGYMNMHGWIGKGWQNQYSWITDNKFHFTGSIGGKVGLDKGDLIDKKFFKIPPFDIGFKTNISFGDFCANSGCTDIEWGMSASISVFGYPAGVYVSAGGPEIFLGSSSIKLVDQYGGGSLRPLASNSYMPINSNPAAQYLTVGYKSPFAGVPTGNGSSLCATANPKVFECIFTVPAGSGRALFMASWLNGILNVSLIKPDGTLITPANAAANGVEITAPLKSLDGYMTSYSVTMAVVPTLPENWKVRLEPVEANTYYSISFAADPPAPAVQWINPLTLGVTPDGGGMLNLQWNATRAGASLPDEVRAELFYAPVIKPRTFPGLVVTFPGNYQSPAGLGANWDPGEPLILGQDSNHDGVWKLDTSSIPAGTYEFKVALNGNWLENYGLDGIRDGVNISFTQPTTNGPLSFYFDASDKFITTRPQSDIIVLVGDMLSETGGADWDPANLVGWLKPTEDAETFEITLHLPEGNWNYKVALNESWAVNYGAGGAPNGPNIPLVVPDGGALVRFTYNTQTHIIAHTILANASGAPIVGKLKANLGAYNWDTRGLASGEYQVGMRIADSVKANASVISWAPGTVVINDTTPPPMPVYFNKSKLQDGLVIRWLRDDITLDLAGYLIEYMIPDWSQTIAFPKTLRVVPVPKSVNPLYQSTRLGGLFGGIPPSNDVQFCIRAYDASGNLSDCEWITELYPIDEEPLPDRVTGLVVSPTATNLTATWNPPGRTTPAGYLVSYEPTGCVLPAVQNMADEGLSPVISPGPPQVLTGLTVGQRYRVGVRAYTLDGAISSEIFQTATNGDPTDADDDFMPDSWEAVFGISDPMTDDDGDGLVNLDEFNAGTFPDEPDSDRDGFYDGEEFEAGSNPCGPGFPPTFPETRLAVVGSSEIILHNPTNRPPVDFQFLTVLNLGAGVMNWEVLASEPWIMVSQMNGQDDQPLLVQADPTGLPVGVYEGTLIIRTTRAAQNGPLAPTSVQETVTVSVVLVVMPVQLMPIYLPVVLRSG